MPLTLRKGLKELDSTFAYRNQHAIMTPDEIYTEWRSSLKSPDDSLFYYHPDLEHILLGLLIYEISSRPFLKDLGKVDSLRILNIYVSGLVTAWIDEDDTFKTMFGLTITVAEMFIPCLMAVEQEYPSKKKQFRKLAVLYGHAVSSGGDMSPALAEALLDDLSTGQTVPLRQNPEIWRRPPLPHPHPRHGHSAQRPLPPQRMVKRMRSLYVGIIKKKPSYRQESKQTTKDISKGHSESFILPDAITMTKETKNTSAA